MFNFVKGYIFSDDYVEKVQNKITLHVMDADERDKKYSKEDIVSLLKTNDKFVFNAFIALNKFNEVPNYGFNYLDKNALKSITKQVFDDKEKYVTFKQIDYIRKHIMKYASQLTYISNYFVANTKEEKGDK